MELVKLSNRRVRMGVRINLLHEFKLGFDEATKPFLLRSHLLKVVERCDSGDKKDSLVLGHLALFAQNFRLKARDEVFDC